MKNHIKLLVALVLGTTLGLVLHPFSNEKWLTDTSVHILQPLGQIFLRLIFMVVVPMVTSALVIGVFELGQGKGLGAVAKKTFLLTAITSFFSVLVGITLVNAIQPGVGMSVNNNSTISIDSSQVEKIKVNAASAKSFSAALVDLIPKNPLDSAVRALDGEMVSLMFFALLFALGLVLTQNQKEDSENLILKLCHEVFNTCMKVVEFAMKLAPLAVFALVFNSALKFGTQLFASLILYILTVVIGLIIQQFLVYSFLLKGFSNLSPKVFFIGIKDVMLYAFATASSNATLPKSLEAAENNLHLPRASSRFVLTVGSTANQNGTALFEGVTVLFLAQVYGVHLGLPEQIQVVLMSVLAGIGTAGVPGGSLPLIIILLQQLGIPADGIAIVLGVDRFLDMCRTAVNVTGDLVIAAIVGSSEKTS